MILTFPSICMVIATVLFAVAVYQSKWRSPTAWAFFLMALAVTWPLVPFGR